MKALRAASMLSVPNVFARCRHACRISVRITAKTIAFGGYAIE
ncbi:MAG TPA: hypothetical protein VNX66_09495 [Candidatus Sulfotelmatobacter sp.]|jgi:hypothetical protein|nr:hypothetical protein [Candidatus Sulfotelmatobacter sp.]